VGAVKLAEQLEDAPGDRRTDDPDRQCPSQQTRQRGDATAAALDGGYRGASMRQQRLARLRQARGAPVAVKENAGGTV
jgi:hypothetical protein